MSCRCGPCRASWLADEMTQTQRLRNTGRRPNTGFRWFVAMCAALSVGMFWIVLPELANMYAG